MSNLYEKWFHFSFTRQMKRFFIFLTIFCVTVSFLLFFNSNYTFAQQTEDNLFGIKNEKVIQSQKSSLNLSSNSFVTNKETSEVGEAPFLVANGNSAEINPSRWISPHGEKPSTYKELSKPLQPFKAESVNLSENQKLGHDFVPSASPVFYILVDSSIYSGISSSINQYKSDVEATGYIVNIHQVSGGTPADIRNLLRNGHSMGLVGCLLVGDITCAWYEIENDFDEEGSHAEFPIDLYYMDLDGYWTDSDSDGIYDGHSGDVAPEIYLGRLKADNIEGNEILLVNNYFTKNHSYRIGNLNVPQRALAYVDDDWYDWADQWAGDLSSVYSDTMLVKDKETTRAINYKSQITQGYEWISVFAHSWSGGHTFKYNNGNSWDYVYSSDIRSIDPPAIFYNLFACSAARYVEYDCIGSNYIFTDDYGLAVVGSTKAGSMWNFNDFYEPFSNYESLGQSFLEWFTSVGITDKSWFYSMTILGDPLLTKSKGFIISFVTRFYQLCLSRDPDAGGLSGWVDGLATGAKTGADVAHGFVFSPEFIQRNVSNEEYVTILYRAFFNREPDSGGYSNWLNHLSTGKSRLWVLAGFVNSQEFKNLCTNYGINPGSLDVDDDGTDTTQVAAFVTRFYQLCLSREPDSAGLDGWVDALLSGRITGADVAHGFVFSPEFIQKNVSNEEYLTILYRAFFNREPDSGGYSNWLNHLSTGKSRLWVLAGFINSQEFRDLCTNYGINPGSINI